jgi:uracil-DNA glycosylase
VSTAAERREELKALWRQASSCTNCPQLAATRKTVVFGSGHADADVMFVGEAPGAREDEQGVPFVGQAGRLLDTLLGEIGLTRGDVFVANVLKCRPPQNRDPLPQEIDACQGYLFRQVELVRPRVVCTLGNFATKLLRNDTTGITRLHGRDELRRIGPRRVRLLPLYHPAAALYTPSMVETLRADFARIPELLALPEPEQPGVEAAGADAGGEVGGSGGETIAVMPVADPAIASLAEVKDEAAPPAGSRKPERMDPREPEPVDLRESEPVDPRELEPAQLGLF